MTRLFCAAAVLVAMATTLGACGENKDTGSGQKTAGHLESAAGSVTGSEHLKREGKKDEVVGGAKSVVHDAKDAVHEATH